MTVGAWCFVRLHLDCALDCFCGNEGQVFRGEHEECSVELQALELLMQW